MKKILLISSLFLAISCTHMDRKVKLDIDLDGKKVENKYNRSVNVDVYDNRSDKFSIGTKTFGDQTVKINSKQHVANYLEKNVVTALAKKGFEKGTNKGLKIEIEEFSYASSRGFIIGKSSAKIKLKVVIATTASKFVTKNFELSVNNKHFIVPLESTDAKIINSLLEEVAQQLLDDQAIINALSE